MTEPSPIVFVVDDDPSVCRAIKRLLESVGLHVEMFGSATEFMNSSHGDVASCLVTDIRLPGISGLDFQRELAKANNEIPTIFITAHGDIPMTVRAMKAGAVEFLTKPFAPAALLRAIESALERSRMCFEEEANLQTLRVRHQALSRREREVLALVVRGRLNKQVSCELGISEITVKQHRGRMMRKMRVRSLPELVTIATRLGLETAGKR
jgi:FixJ family two-component response regulator